MTKNNSALDARRAQDVEAAPRRESHSNTHIGRGGAANVFRPSPEEVVKMKADSRKWESAVGDERSVDKEREEERERERKAEMGIAERGKEWLFGKGGKK